MSERITVSIEEGKAFVMPSKLVGALIRSITLSEDATSKTVVLELELEDWPTPAPLPEDYWESAQ